MDERFTPTCLQLSEIAHVPGGTSLAELAGVSPIPSTTDHDLFLLPRIALDLLAGDPLADTLAHLFGGEDVGAAVAALLSAPDAEVRS